MPPTVADTKANFYRAFSTPLPSIYNNVIMELLVQQHLMRYNNKYQYDPVRSAGHEPFATADTTCGMVPIALPYSKF